MSIICQGTQEVSHPAIHWVIDLQTLALAMDPGEAHELAPALLGRGPGTPGEHCLRQSPMAERAFVEVQ